MTGLVGGVMDPRELARLRREAAEEAARTQAAAELGAAEGEAYDRRVDELVAAWTAGWDGAGLPTVGGLLGWFRRRR